MDLGQLFGAFLPMLEGAPWLRAALAVVLVFFLPGFAWSLVFFHRVNIVERVALAIGLSIASVTLSIVVLNVLLHITINGVNSVLIIIVLTAVPLAIYLFQWLQARRATDIDGD